MHLAAGKTAAGNEGSLAEQILTPSWIHRTPPGHPCQAPQKAPVSAPTPRLPLKMNSEAFLKAIQAVTNKTVTIEAIEAKYSLEPAVRVALEKALEAE